MRVPRVHELLLVLSVAPCPCDGYTWTAQTTQCARMSGDQSNIWPDSANGFRSNFDLHVMFPLSNDPDFMEKTVRVEFSRPLTIERVEPQGAVIATSGGPNFVEVEVSPAYVGHEYFSIQGFREGGGTHEDMLSPTITCSGGSDVPPPAPPHSTDCDLMPEYGAYPLGGTREAGSDVTIKLSRWIPFRTFTVVYYKQEGLLVSKTQGVTVQANPQRVGDQQVGFTFTLDPAGSDGLRCEGHPACIEFEVKPTPHHKPHISCVDSPPPSPPRPPPKLPPPSAKPPPSPTVAGPPPMTRQVRAAPSCHLGGAAKVLDVQQTPAGKVSVRIAVTLDTWIDGYLVSIGMEGDGIEVTRAIHAAHKMNGMTHTFSLGEEPIEMSAFAVVLEAHRFRGVTSMTCQAPASPPPTPLATSSGVDQYYGDDATRTATPSHTASPVGGVHNVDTSMSYGGHIAGGSSQRANENTLNPAGTDQESTGSSAAIGVVLVLATIAVGVGLVAKLKPELLQMFASQVGNNSRPKAGRLRDEEMNDAFDGSDDKGSVINDSSASRIVDALEMVPHEEESGDGEIILGRPDA
jgi:hypothetical protein